MSFNILIHDVHGGRYTESSVRDTGETSEGGKMLTVSKDWENFTKLCYFAGAFQAAVICQLRVFYKHTLFNYINYIIIFLNATFISIFPDVRHAFNIRADEQTSVP